jgi:hypothetical protein
LKKCFLTVLDRAVRLNDQGTATDGDPFQLLDREPGSAADSADGAYIEAPSLTLKDGTYYRK